jgi:hypothetical protein
VKRGNYSIFHNGYLVIKSVAYFPLQCAQNSGPVMQAMIDSLKRVGITPKENSMDADAAIIWSVLWSGRMSANQTVWTAYRNAGKPVIIVDVGALYRGETWKIALNNITADGYYGHTENLDWNRPRKLGISLALNLSRNPRIVVAAQHARSLQVAGLISIEDWVMKQIEQLKQATDRPIVVRPHPRSQLKLIGLPQNVEIELPQKIVNSYDSYNLAFDCHAIVNHNSGPGIQAALAGTRPIVDHSSLASPVSINLENIDQPYTVDRDQWLVEICHTEYTVKEIEQGYWLDRLGSELRS